MAISKAEADRLLKQACERYYETSYKYCLVRTHYARGSEEDSVQNAFLVYYQRLLKGEHFNNVQAFICRTCENMCRRADDHFLKDSRRKVELEAIPNLPANETDALAAKLDYDGLKEKLLCLLSDEEQQLFRLKYEQGKSLNEIGALLEISPNAAALRVSRMRKKIKALATATIEEYRKGGIR